MSTRVEELVKGWPVVYESIEAFDVGYSVRDTVRIFWASDKVPNVEMKIEDAINLAEELLKACRRGLEYRKEHKRKR